MLVLIVGVIAGVSVTATSEPSKGDRADIDSREIPSVLHIPLETWYLELGLVIAAGSFAVAMVPHLAHASPEEGVSEEDETDGADEQGEEHVDGQPDAEPARPPSPE